MRINQPLHDKDPVLSNDVDRSNTWYTEGRLIAARMPEFNTFTTASDSVAQIS